MRTPCTTRCAKSGLTDYGLVTPTTLGKRHLITFATDRPKAAEDLHIAALKKLLAIRN